MLKVYSSCCENCLLSKNRIVSPERAKEILKEISDKQSYFVCHNASQNSEEIVCKTFYDKLGHQSQMIQIAERLNVVEFIEQKEQGSFVSYLSIFNKKKSI